MHKSHFLALVALTSIAILLLNKGITDDAFDEWKVKFGVNFVDDENSYRKMIFQRNV
jgi:hypothetical protein